MREQLSFLPALLQVSVAFGARRPAGHFTSSKRTQNTQQNVKVNHIQCSHSPGAPPTDQPPASNANRNYRNSCSKQNSAVLPFCTFLNRLWLLLTTRGQCRRIHTNAVFPVPVQLESWRTGTLVAAKRVDAAELAAPSIYTALVNICGNMNFRAFSEGVLVWSGWKMKK